jgi:hypothetical protein
MKKRRSKRIVIGLKAEIISGGISCEGVIDNLSEDGIFVITAPSKTEMDFTSGTILEVNFQFMSEETLHLKCKVKWSHKTPPHHLTHRIGMEIIESPWDMNVTPKEG